MRPDDPRRGAPARDVPTREVPMRELPTREVPTRELPTRELPTRELSMPATRELTAPPSAGPGGVPGAAKPGASSPNKRQALVDAAKRQAAGGMASVAQAARAMAPKPSSATAPKAIAHDPISKLLRGIEEVAYEALTIIEHPRSFPEKLKLDDDKLFAHGTRFLLGTVPAIFLLLLPVHMIHGRPVTQTSVGVLFTIIAFTSGPMVYVALRAVGSRRTTLGAAVGMNCYMMGAQGLAMIVLSYPVALRYGSKVFFGLTPDETNAIFARMTVADQWFLVGNLLVAYAVLFVWFFRAWIHVFARYFEIPRQPRVRTLLALLIPFTVTSMLVQRYLPQLQKAAETL